MLEITAICLTLTAFMAYLNHRFVGLPPTVGVMGIAMLLSLALFGLDTLGFSALHDQVRALVGAIDFTGVLMQGMLSILLFAGALHVDLSELRAHRRAIAALAMAGTLASTLLIGFVLWWALALAGLTLPLAYCLVFGALISPTDPIAVMGILKSAKAPANLEIVIAGESLFNDGVGVVLFALMASMVGHPEPPPLGQAGLLLLREGGGGLAFGVALGYATYLMLRSIDSYQEEVLITLAAVVGGYTLANHLHVSGPLAMVAAGLIVGNHGRAEAMSDQTRRHVDSFWELLDAIFNAVLFMLIGMEILLVPLSWTLAAAAVVALLVTLGARFASVGLPILLWRRHAGLPHGSWQVLTWGGLRGGISVALALSLPASSGRDIVVTLTYVVVVFSILIQGGSMGPLVKQWIVPAPAA
ncbi:MAG TPA: sodium:proton antiporter [Telluria sp.]|nr:sodium:proton antiporter [Telluria sp.]